MSARRLRLQNRIDFIRGNGAAPADGEAILRSLLEEEREVSERRREVHARIDELRVTLGLHPGPPRKPPRLG